MTTPPTFVMYGSAAAVGDIVSAGKVVNNPTLNRIEVRAARVLRPGLRRFRVTRAFSSSMTSDQVRALVSDRSFGGNATISWCELEEVAS